MKIRPLNLRNQAIARIAAFKPGPIHTLYSLTLRETASLLRATKAHYRINSNKVVNDKRIVVIGGGFGSAEENRKVEKAAMKAVYIDYEKSGWKVSDFSARRGLGCDLECRCGQSVLHVEVKGTKGTEKKFILTQNEEQAWKLDKRFWLVLVTNALNNKRKIFRYHGPNSLKSFDLKPIAYLCAGKNP